MRELLASDEPRRARRSSCSCSASPETGALAASLGGLDGSSSPPASASTPPDPRRVCERLAWLGIALDAAPTRAAMRDSTPDSRVIVRVIPTDEEIMIARHAFAVASA